MTPEAQALVELAERVERAGGMNNGLDVLVEIALFEPDAQWASIRANDVGTKTICTAHDGRERTFWARDYTISPKQREATYAANNLLPDSARLCYRNIMFEALATRTTSEGWGGTR